MLAEYLTDYGYLVVAVGAFIEGETILLLAGYAAQQGALDVRLVLLLGFVGAFAGDQLWFYLARRHGSRWLERRPHLVAKATNTKRLLERHATLFILSFRFIYGLRNLGAVAVALSDVSTRRFFLLNAAAAALWSVLVIGTGPPPPCSINSQVFKSKCWPSLGCSPVRPSLRSCCGAGSCASFRKTRTA